MKILVRLDDSGISHEIINCSSMSAWEEGSYTFEGEEFSHYRIDYWDNNENCLKMIDNILDFEVI